jgi:hypothetical protein
MLILDRMITQPWPTWRGDESPVRNQSLLSNYNQCKLYGFHFFDLPTLLYKRTRKSLIDMGSCVSTENVEARKLNAEAETHMRKVRPFPIWFCRANNNWSLGLHT